MKWIRNTSIKIKLMVGFSLIFLFLIIMLLLLNHLFVDDYFIHVNEKAMHESANEVLERNNVDYSQISRDDLRDIERQTGGAVQIIDEIRPPVVGGQNIRFLHDIEDSQDLMASLKNVGEYGVIITGGEDYETQSLVYVRRVTTTEFLVVIKVLGLISESQRMFMSFLVSVSLFVYLVSLGLTYLYADRITKPIVQLQTAANRISNLNFEEKMIPKGKDEIGDLITSINTMADELAFNIKALNTSNFLLTKELNKEVSLEKMRRRFVSDVSHELKNPIGMIIGYAEGLEKGIPKTEEDKAYYAHVLAEEGKRMDRLVKDLLDLSSYMSGTFVLECSDVDLQESVADIQERYSHLSDSQKIKFTVEMKDFTKSYTSEKSSINKEMKNELTSNFMVHIDPHRMEQVLINLLDNAFKHTHENGEILVSVNKLDKEIELIVSNTGDLIPEEDLDSIWESFYQVDTDTQGNGLGLAIVKSIVELHEGKIRVDVDSKMNHFKIVLKNVT